MKKRTLVIYRTLSDDGVGGSNRDGGGGGCTDRDSGDCRGEGKCDDGGGTSYEN